MIRAALAYFGITFGAGFVLGIVRVLWLVPLVGVRVAELIEIPLMIVISAIAARLVVGRFRLKTSGDRLGMGLLALSILVVAEILLNVFLANRTLADYITGRDPVSGIAYFGALVLFGCLPLLVSKR